MPGLSDPFLQCLLCLPSGDAMWIKGEQSTGGCNAFDPHCIAAGTAQLHWKKCRSAWHAISHHQFGHVSHTWHMRSNLTDQLLSMTNLQVYRIGSSNCNQPVTTVRHVIKPVCCKLRSHLLCEACREKQGFCSASGLPGCCFLPCNAAVPA